MLDANILKMHNGIELVPVGRFVLKEKCLVRKGIVKYTKANDIIALCKHVTTINQISKFIHMLNLIYNCR
jgi:hypothetical protein